LTKERYTNFELWLDDDSRISKRNRFIREVVKAHVAASPKHQESVQHWGEGVFMISGRNGARSSQF
jgi:hypothetical protein